MSVYIVLEKNHHHFKIHFTCLNPIIDNGGSVIPFLRNFPSKKTKYSKLYNAVILISGEKLGKRIKQKFHLPIKSELLKRLTSLL